MLQCWKLEDYDPANPEVGGCVANAFDHFDAARWFAEETYADGDPDRMTVVVRDGWGETRVYDVSIAMVPGFAVTESSTPVPTVSREEVGDE